MNDASPPLVSVVVRSTDRPQLAGALGSLARQACSSLEILIVDATGGRHRPLPPVSLRDGHSLRVVSSDRPLSRPQAANAGIDAARGAFLSFLDDDDTCEPEHLQSLLDAASSHPDKLVVYGGTRVIGTDGRVERVVGTPFNRVFLYHGPKLFWQAGLIRMRVRDLGCRVEESLHLCEDRDFLAQVAVHSDFAFVPGAAFNYRAHAADGDEARLLEYEALFRARWSGPAAYHLELATRWCRRAVHAYACGRRTDARRWFLHVLDQYPGYPDALMGLARLQVDEGALEDALANARAAIEVDGGTPEHHLTLARILQRLGDEAGAHVARTTLRGSRIAPCGCGSGRRYKDCCGRLRASHPIASPATASRVASALHEAARGEAVAAAQALAIVAPGEIDDAASCSALAELHARLARYGRAVEFQRHAVALSPDGASQRALYRYCEQLHRSRAASSAYDTARALLRPERGAPATAPASPLHLVTSLAALGGTEMRALSLRDLLAPHADVTLWSVAAPHAAYAARAPMRMIGEDDFPRGGTVVFVGTFFDYGDWLHRAGFARVVVCYNIELPQQLVQRLTHIREALPDVPVELTFPTQHFRTHTGLPGHVELAPLDLRGFVVHRPAMPKGATLVIGRHSRDDPDKHHPNDPSLYRKLTARGHRVRILGGTPLAAALAHDSGIELLPVGVEQAHDFLATLDCFVYRKSPGWYEVGGNVILEAMASALPVVVFDEGCGGVEWIEHGISGFVVRDEHQALEIVHRLAAAPAFRRAVGDAARRRAVQLVEQQGHDTLAFYLRHDPDEASLASSAATASGPPVSRFVASPLRHAQRRS